MGARIRRLHVLRPRLLSVAGVSQVIPIGGEVRQVRVAPDPRAWQFGVSLTQIEQTFARIRQQRRRWFHRSAIAANT